MLKNLAEDQLSKNAAQFFGKPGIIYNLDENRQISYAIVRFSSIFFTYFANLSLKVAVLALTFHFYLINAVSVLKSVH